MIERGTVRKTIERICFEETALVEVKEFLANVRELEQKSLLHENAKIELWSSFDGLVVIDLVVENPESDGAYKRRVADKIEENFKREQQEREELARLLKKYGDKP